MSYNEQQLKQGRMLSISSIGFIFMIVAAGIKPMKHALKSSAAFGIRYAINEKPCSHSLNN